jgi:hypothetical protein
MKLIGLTVAFSLLTSLAFAKKPDRPANKGKAVTTINTLRGKGGDISFTCSPTNCREQEDGSILFTLSCQTNKEGDTLEVQLGKASQTIQSYGLVEIPEDIQAPKKGTVPIKIFASEQAGSPQTIFTFKYTVDQVKKPSCRKFGELAL